MTQFAVNVEFYGSLRLRAAVPHVVVPLRARADTVGYVLSRLAQEYPQLTGFCLDEHGMLHVGFLVNLDGREFTRDVSRQLNDGQTLILLAADVGG